MPNPTSFSSHEEYLDWYRSYRKKNANSIREYKRNYIRNYRLIHGMKKDNARNELNTAIKNGSIKKGVCAICGDEKTHGHHEDYSKPLDVVWLCLKHHRAIHRRYPQIST
jgi:hypothetical protein